VKGLFFVEEGLARLGPRPSKPADTHNKHKNTKSAALTGGLFTHSHGRRPLSGFRVLRLGFGSSLFALVAQIGAFRGLAAPVTMEEVAVSPLSKKEKASWKSWRRRTFSSRWQACN